VDVGSAADVSKYMLPKFETKSRYERMPASLSVLLQHLSGYAVSVFKAEVSGLGLSVKLLVVLASTVILGSRSRRTHDHILLSYDSGSRTMTIVSECGQSVG
jgi:hypothetical protein